MQQSGSPWAWVQALPRFGPQPGLERMRTLLARLGQPQEAMQVVLVAGTNGKGSVTALLDAMLRADIGRRAAIGRFVSPHLHRFEERFWVEGAPVPPDELEPLLEELRPVAESLGATFFEVLTAVALLAFARAGVGTAVLEVGMGGRLDASNATEPLLSVITQVALDHEGVLGDTLEAIAAEKAGVLRPGRPAVTSAQGPALEVIRRRAQAMAVRLTVLDDLNWSQRSSDWSGVVVHGLGPGPVTTPLLGRHQGRNLATAVLAAHALGLPWQAVTAGAAMVRWPGRLEALQAYGRRWLLDGAHNPAGAVALLQALSELGVQPAVAVVGVSADKDHDAMAAAIARMAPRLLLTRAMTSPRAADPVALHDRLRAFMQQDALVETWETPAEARVRALELAPPGATVLVAGSLYLVAEMREQLQAHQTR